MLLLRQMFVLAAVGLVGAIALACGSTESTTPTPTAAPIATPTVVVEPTQIPTSSPAAAPTHAGYDPSSMMYRIFPGFGLTSIRSIEALREARERKDISQVPVIIEAMRFYASQDEMDEAAATLRALTGQGYSGEEWHQWMEWLGKHSREFRPPEKYLEWKLSLLTQIDPRYRLFLRDADKVSRIDLTEVVWGGVPPDGIPDLRNPPRIPAQDADYLGPDERVFGVSISGQHRAYPLRIVNAHEMANDVLGGEPIALAY